MKQAKHASQRPQRRIALLALPALVASSLALTAPWADAAAPQDPATVKQEAAEKAMKEKKAQIERVMQEKKAAEKQAAEKQGGRDIQSRKIPGLGGGGTPSRKAPVQQAGQGPTVDPHAGHDHGPGEHVGDDGSRTVDANKLKNPYGGETDENAKLDIEFGSEKHDFGRARQGAKLEHTFEMLAGGTSDLIIRQAKPTCGCTVSTVMVSDDTGAMAAYNFGDPIPPGRKVEISAAMDTKNKRNKTAVRVNVYANDPVGLHQLALEATVEPFLNVNPTFVNFGDLMENSVQTSKIDVRTTKGERVLLTIGESPKPLPMPEGLDIKLNPINPDEEGKSNAWNVQITAGPNLKEGQLGYSLLLETDHDMIGADPNPDGTMQKYAANASIQGRVLGPISCTPEYFSMGLVTPGQVVTRSVTLQSNDESIDLGNVTVSLGGYRDRPLPWEEHFEAKVEPMPEQNAVRVSLTLNGLPEGSNGSFQGQMTILTGTEVKPEITATFSGVCRASTPAQPQQQGPPQQGPPVKKETQGN